MSRSQSPSPLPSAAQPTYEGRTLARPDDEVVDQGLAFDLTTLFNRRRALQFLGLGAAGGLLTACGVQPSTATSSAANTAGLTEIPDETAGPYPGDGSNGADVLEQSGVIRSDIRSSFGDTSGRADGIGLTLTLTVLDIAAGGSPMAGAAVYVWHCDRAGLYSMYSDAIKNENYLRGVQVTDADGRVSYTSIFPACYAGRWPHIHFEVYPDAASITDSTTAIATSQVALPQSSCDVVYATAGYQQSVANLAGLSLATDNVFGDDGGVHQLGTVTGDVSKGYAVTLTVPVDTGTSPSGGSAPGGRPGGTPPSGGPGGTPPERYAEPGQQLSFRPALGAVPADAANSSRPVDVARRASPDGACGRSAARSHRPRRCRRRASPDRVRRWCRSAAGRRHCRCRRHRRRPAAPRSPSPWCRR